MKTSLVLCVTNSNSMIALKHTYVFVKLEMVGSFYQFMYHCSLFFKYRSAGAVDI